MVVICGWCVVGVWLFNFDFSCLECVGFAGGFCLIDWLVF